MTQVDLRYLRISTQNFSTVDTAVFMGVGGSVTHSNSPRGKLQTMSPYMLPALVAYRLQWVLRNTTNETSLHSDRVNFGTVNIQMMGEHSSRYQRNSHNAI